MAKIKVIAKYFAFSKSNPKNGPQDGDFDSPDIAEAERFEIFFPQGGCPSKKEYVDKIRESGDLQTVEKSMYGKGGNIVKFYKYHEKRRVVLNSKEQFDDLIENVKGTVNDPRLHIKLIPQEVIWKIGPGGTLDIQGKSNVNKGKPSQNEMEASILVDKKVKEITSILVKQEKVYDCRVYRTGNNIYIFCKCGKHIKTKPTRGAKSVVTAFMYDHYNTFHRPVETSDEEDTPESGERPKKRNRLEKKNEKAQEKKKKAKPSDEDSSELSADESDKADEAGNKSVENPVPGGSQDD